MTDTDTDNLDDSDLSQKTDETLEDSIDEIDETAESPSRKKGVGLLTVLMFSLLAAGVGTVGGFGLTQYLTEQPDTAKYASLETQLTTKIDALQTELRSAKARQDRLDTELKALKTRPAQDPVTPTVDAPALADITTRLDTLETQITTIGDDTSQPDLTLAIETPEDEPTIEPEVIETLQTRLADLTVRLDELEANTPNIVPLQTELSALQSRLDNATADMSKQLTSTNRRIGGVETQIDDIKATPSTYILPPFPKDAVLTALSKTGQEGQNWFFRALGKHVVIRDEDAIGMSAQVEALIAEGDIQSALDQINNWPDPARIAAKDWVRAAQNAVN